MVLLVYTCTDITYIKWKLACRRGNESKKAPSFPLSLSLPLLFSSDGMESALALTFSLLTKFPQHRHQHGWTKYRRGSTPLSVLCHPFWLGSPTLTNLKSRLLPDFVSFTSIPNGFWRAVDSIPWSDVVLPSLLLSGLFAQFCGTEMYLDTILTAT